MLDGQPLIHLPLVWSDAWILGCQFNLDKFVRKGHMRIVGCKFNPLQDRLQARSVPVDLSFRLSAPRTHAAGILRFASAHFVEWHMDLVGCKFNRVAILEKAGSFPGSLS